MRSTLPYAEISDTLKTCLGLDGSPVAIKLAKNAQGIPEGMEELKEPARHCRMVNMARREDAIFYATAEKHQCMGGAWALGLRELTDSLRSGEFYYKLGKFESWAGCMRTIDSVPHVPTGRTYATLYAPLETTPFDPHVVVIVAQPRSMLKLAQSVLYPLGGRINSSMSGIQSLCADTTALPYISGRPNFSLGCDGSRKFSGIEDADMVMGMPAELLPEIAESIKLVTGAPGSV